MSAPGTRLGARPLRASLALALAPTLALPLGGCLLQGGSLQGALGDAKIAGLLQGQEQAGADCGAIAWGAPSTPNPVLRLWLFPREQAGSWREMRSLLFHLYDGPPPFRGSPGSESWASLEGAGDEVDSPGNIGGGGVACQT